jgi:hypothetical protein
VVLPHPLLLAVLLLLLLVAVPVPRPLLLVAVLVLVKEPPLLMPRQLVWMLRLRLPLLVARNKISVLVPEVLLVVVWDAQDALTLSEEVATGL